MTFFTISLDLTSENPKCTQIQGQRANFSKNRLVDPKLYNLEIFSYQIRFQQTSKLQRDDFGAFVFFKQTPTALRVHLRDISVQKIVRHIKKPLCPYFRCLSAEKCVRGSVGRWVQFVIFGPSRVRWKTRLAIGQEKVSQKSLWKSDSKI